MATQGRTTETAVPQRGALMYDPVTRRVGVYQDEAGPYVLLRPVGGGREWEADPAQVRLATLDERLGAGVVTNGHGVGCGQ